jgi:3-isopropylmalate/(R)-2-methylmalate dehydratase small subunit
LVAEEPETTVTVNLAQQTVALPDGRTVSFPIDSFSKTCLLEGIDQLGYLLQQEDKVLAYEAKHAARVNTGA